ncbi:MAG: DUF2281 domain-containing protein [Bacteroidales bacterium]|nr:DUF2281 domain-containing protein [Bacteroidales bacterium]
MNRKALLEKLKTKIALLPDNKIQEVNDFADFLLSKIDDQITVEAIQKLASNSKAFDFLKEDEDLYSVNDLKEKYK